MQRSVEYTYIRDDSPVYGTERMITRLIDIVVAVAEFVLGLRFVLHFLGAGRSNAFMVWLNAVTDQLIAPFAGIFPTWYFGSFSVELTTLFAMLAYAAIGWIMAKAIILLVSTLRPVA